MKKGHLKIIFGNKDEVSKDLVIFQIEVDVMLMSQYNQIKSNQRSKNCINHGRN